MEQFVILGPDRVYNIVHEKLLELLGCPVFPPACFNGQLLRRLFTKAQTHRQIENRFLMLHFGNFVGLELVECCICHTTLEISNW